MTGFRLRAPRWFGGRRARRSLEEVFTRIWAENRWRSPETRSGPGSSLERTRSVRAALPALLRRLGVRSLLDVPCGDFHWLAEVELDLESYVGADIVPALIEENRRRHGRPGRTFLRLDLTRDDLPAADLVLCRDGLIHLSFADAARAVSRMRASGSTWLLTTTFRALARNRDKPSGRSRLLNLERPPFGWPPPVEVVPEDAAGRRAIAHAKSLGLWRLAALP
ncbi:MAG: class I SAM-dependent methyltransferase [Planctomycetota bacterium]